MLEAWGTGRVGVLNKVVREGDIQKEVRDAGGVRRGLWDGDSVLGRENIRCKGPAVGPWGYPGNIENCLAEMS